MAPHLVSEPAVPQELLDRIASFPTRREVTHCGTTFTASPFDIYATCPTCGTRIKVRAFSGNAEVEDVFDAVFAWMNRPEARAIAEHRRKAVEDDE